MKKCLECKKFMWPWQQKSTLNALPSLHAKCHSISITKYINSLEGVEIIRSLRELNSNNSNVRYLGKDQ